MLASVGPQNGRGSLAYENLNLLSVSDLAEFGEDVTDGSTYARDTWIGGIKHLKGETVHFRFEANAYIYQQSKLEDILANIAVCGRSVYTYDEIGRIKIIIDRPVDYSVGVISQQNCISGSNNFDFTDNFAGYQIQYPDEDNGYENGLFYCWTDGNSLKNYKGQVTPLSLAFVTNSNQAWSLGRYAAACAILQKNVLTRKIGREGCTFNIGDVLEVQSEELLIGNDSGRIQQILEVNGKVAGFITDATYEYSGKKKDGKVIQGVSILQPQRFGSDRVKTLRLAEKNTQIECNNEFYTLKKGVTNLVLFEEPVNFSDSGFYFNPGDTVLFGEYGKVSEKYRIIKTKPESDKTYTQTLIPYLPELYNYGDKLPVFHPAITEPEVTRDIVSLSEVPVNLEEQNNLQKDTIDIINDKISNIYSNHITTLYKRSTSQIKEHGITSQLIYDFTVNALEWESEEGSNGWKFTIEETGTEGDLYSVSATAFGQSATYTFDTNEWSDPMPYGQNGTNGINVYTIQMFQRSLVKPALLPENVKYNFDTTSLTASDFHKWLRSFPEIDDEGLPVWEIHATASSNTNLDEHIENWSEPKIISKDIQVTKADIEIIIDEMGLTPTPVVNSNITFMGVQTNADGFVTVDQSVNATVSVRQGFEELDFTFGEIILPNKYWDSEINENTVTIKVKKGARVIGGNIIIPISYNSYAELYMYGPSENEGYENNDHEPYGSKILTKDGTIYELSLGYTMVKGGARKTPVSSIFDLPEEPVIGDYFTWIGENTESSLCEQGVFKQTGIYQWNGLKWEVDNNTEHMAGSLSDVLSVADAAIGTGNPMVDELLGRLTANETFTKKLVVTDGAFIKALATSEIVVGENSSDLGYIKSAGYIQGQSGWKIDNKSAEFNSVRVRGSVTATAFILEDQAVSDFNNIIDSYSFATIDSIEHIDILHYRSTTELSDPNSIKPISKITSSSVTSDNQWSLGSFGPKKNCYYYRCEQRWGKNNDGTDFWRIEGNVTVDTEPQQINILSDRTTLTESNISDITSDNVLTPNEKQDLLEEWNSIIAERPILKGKGVSFTAYENAFLALAKILNGGTNWTSGTPSLISDITTKSSVNGANLRAAFVNYNTEKTKLLDSINQKYANDAEKNAIDKIPTEKDLEKFSRVSIIPEIPSIVFQVDKSGKTIATQSVRIPLKAYVGQTEITFNIRDDKFSDSNFTMYHEENCVILQIVKGKAITEGVIQIPVSTIEQTVYDYPYGYDNLPYGPDSNTQYRNETYISGTEIYYASITYQAIYGNRYRNAVDSVTLIQPPALIDDFFTWTGNDITAVINGVSVDLIKGCVYKWNGYGWERDKSTGHFSTALSDILDINNNLLKQNNSDVEQFFKKIVSKQIFTDQLVAEDAFINQLASSNAFINKLGTENLVIHKDETGEGYICSEDYIDSIGVEGFYLGADGSFIANDALIRGSIYSDDGLIGGITIDEKGISTPLGNGKGFQINKDGTALFNYLTAKSLYIGNDAVETFINNQVTEDINNKNKGAWLSSVTYSKGDIVTYDGSSYSALRASTNKIPSSNTSDWIVYASKGKYMQHLYYAGNFGLNKSDLINVEWSTTQPTLSEGQCLYEATKWSE